MHVKGMCAPWGRPSARQAVPEAHPSHVQQVHAVQVVVQEDLQQVGDVALVRLEAGLHDGPLPQQADHGGHGLGAVDKHLEEHLLAVRKPIEGDSTDSNNLMNMLRSTAYEQDNKQKTNMRDGRWLKERWEKGDTIFGVHGKLDAHCQFACICIDYEGKVCIEKKG